MPSGSHLPVAPVAGYGAVTGSERPRAVWCDVRVAVMSTCIGDAMFPDAVRATVRLLRRLGCAVEVPEAQTCCGQPMVNTGYLDEAVPLVRTFVSAFEGYDHVVVPSGSCAGSVRHQHALVAARVGRRRRWWMPWRAPRRGPWS